MSSNVHVLPVRAPRRPNPSPDPLAALYDLSRRVAEVGMMPIETKEDLRQAVLLLDLFNLQARQLIGRIDDDAGRAHLLTHSNRIGELVEMARQYAAAL